MNFSFVDNLGLGISIDLEVLKRKSQRNKLLLYQHEGVLAATPERIGNQNLEEAYTQFNHFFTKAKLEHVDLALAPEYSCPWSAITEILNDVLKHPAPGKLWVIGAESITKAELRDFQQNFNRDDIILHFETEVLESGLSFLDPLIYLFVSIKDGVQKLVVLLQFKTHHMGVWGGGIIERDNMIEGNEIYILRNAGTSINFISLICSEAMNFQDNFSPAINDFLTWEDIPYLIFNPQCNPIPAHPNFASFRKFIFRFERKEIISLNWNGNSKIGNEDLLKFGSSRSALFIKSDEVNLHAGRIRHNHQSGLYYFTYGINSHAFILNSYVQIYLMETPPVMLGGALPVQMRRDGPEIRNTYKFNADKSELDIFDTPILDGLIKYLTDVGCNNQFFLHPGKCILEKERLACLTSGKIIQGKDWWEVENLQSLHLNKENEVNLRITLAEDTDPPSIQEKTVYLRAINELDNTILLDKSLYPDSIADLKSDELVLGYYNNSEADLYKYNVITTTQEKRVATICYLDTAPTEVVESTFDLLQSLFDPDNNNKRCVVIFYKRGNEIRSKWDIKAGKIDETNDYDGPSILK